VHRLDLLGIVSAILLGVIIGVILYLSYGGI
jgi:hypothetical protein